MGEYVAALKKYEWSKVGEDSWEYSAGDGTAHVRFDVGDGVWLWGADSGGRKIRGTATTLSRAVRNVQSFMASDVDASGVTYEMALDYLVTVASFREMRWGGADWLEDVPLHDMDIRCLEAIQGFVPFDMNGELESHGGGLYDVWTKSRKRAALYMAVHDAFVDTGTFPEIHGLGD